MQELHTQSIPDVFANDAAERVSRKTESESKLDALISGAQDDAEKPDDFEDFVAARPYRQELAERHGADAAGVVDRFSFYNNELRNHGALAGEMIAGDYLANTNVAKLLHATEKQGNSKQIAAPAEPSDDLPEHVTHKKLDAILDSNIEEHDSGIRERERAEFDKARTKFDALRAENPSLTWQDFFKTTAHTDRELLRDPGFAHRLVAASGVPVTPLQQEMAKIQADRTQQFNAMDSMITEMERNGHLVDLARHAPAMAEVLQRPGFVKSSDPRMDVWRANRIAELEDVARLQEMERKTAVEKAQRAGPVKATGGMSHAADLPRAGGLDASIGAALSGLGD